MSPERCLIINDAHKMGLTAASIAEYYGMPRSTVCNILRRMRTATVPPKQGRPWKLNASQLRLLETFVAENRFMPLHLLAANFNSKANVSISVNTLRRYIHRLGFASRTAAEKPFLRERNVLKRTLWGIMHIGWSIPDWARVLFTDESSFCVRPIKRKLRVWRKKKERYDVSCMVHTFKSGRKSVNVWGGFSFFGRTPLYRINGKFNGKKYLEVIQSTMFPSVLSIFGNLHNFILQEDNCGPHRSVMVKEYLTQIGVTRMFWPAQSPDLNPIENCWGWIKQQLRKRTTYCKNEDELFTLLQQMWNNLSQEYFKQLVGGMSKRVEAVMNAKGGATKY